jgi:hypothetical protein
MICPNCSQETEGRNHNGRGWRCTHCWAALPTPQAEAAPVVIDLSDGVSQAEATVAGKTLAAAKPKTKAKK